ncbi:MAG: hypothetical protein RIS70_3334 [Planctomycetota bacterium]
MTRYTILTGGTGLVGRYLVRDLLLEGHPLALLIRPTSKLSVADRAEEILQFWESQLGRPLSRPVLLDGDVCREGLGLAHDDRCWVERHCGSLIHNAASLTFNGADRAGEPWRTNLDGTRHVLEFCRTAGIRDLHYVSTAYVAGTRSGVIYETELDCGQSFRNEYEQSKCLAEKEVRAASFLDQLTVYRPAVIAGDSRTGYTSTYHGLCMYLQLISVINRNTEPDEHGVRHTDIRLNMTGDEPRNIVPVDWVSEVIATIFGNPAFHGQTYHLSPEERLTPRQIVEAGYRYYNSTGVEFCGAETQIDETVSTAERATYESKTMYEAYEHSDPVFDTTNLQRAVPQLPCPVIDQAMLHRFWKYGEEDRWGRRKPAEITVPVWIAEVLAKNSTEILARFLDQNPQLDTPHVKLGIDIVGPGGGQWTLLRDSQQGTRLERGIAADVCGVLQESSERFANFVAKSSPASNSPFKLNLAISN